jgi:hypothetical protein
MCVPQLLVRLFFERDQRVVEANVKVLYERGLRLRAHLEQLVGRANVERLPACILSQIGGNLASLNVFNIALWCGCTSITSVRLQNTHTDHQMCNMTSMIKWYC